MNTTQLRDAMRHAAWLDNGAAGATRSHFESFLLRLHSAIEGESRQPDPWEETHVQAAMEAARLGAYRLASTFVDLALAPIRERGDEWRNWPNDGTLDRMRSDFAELNSLAMPLAPR